MFVYYFGYVRRPFTDVDRALGADARKLLAPLAVPG
jgi:hypothetical protein